jgi:hypothetical protein
LRLIYWGTIDDRTDCVRWEESELLDEEVRGKFGRDVGPTVFHGPSSNYYVRKKKDSWTGELADYVRWWIGE